MTAANTICCKLLSKSSINVFSSFKETQDKLQTAIETLESIRMPIEQLKEKMDAFDNVIETIKLGLEI